MIPLFDIAASAATVGAPGRAPDTAGGASASPVPFTMPLPPSVNKAFRNVTGRGRALTQKTKDWKSEALWRLKAQRLPLVIGPVVIVFGFERPSMSADADNRLKLAQDALVSAGVIEDDNRVIGGAFAWLPMVNGLCHGLVVPAQRLTLEFHPSDDGAVGGWVMTAPQQQLESADGA